MEKTYIIELTEREIRDIRFYLKAITERCSYLQTKTNDESTVEYYKKQRNVIAGLMKKLN